MNNHIRKIIFLASLLCFFASWTSPATASVHHERQVHEHHGATLGPVHEKHEHDVQAASPEQIHEDHDHGGLNEASQKNCKHHPFCPPAHFCELNSHECHGTDGPASPKAACSISSGCGGAKSDASPSHYSHEFIFPSIVINRFAPWGRFLPIRKGAHLAGFTDGIEYPPKKYFSLL